MDRRIDPYDVLGVAPDADPDVIRAAYRALAKKYHPDAQPEGKEQAEKKLRELNQAYEVLSDADRRARYDQERGGRDPAAGDSSQAEGTAAKHHTEWTILEKQHPEMAFKYQQLLKMSRPLAAAYRRRVVREKAFTRYDQISSEVVNEFASRYFGSNTTVQRFGLWCLSNNHRTAALELNRIISKLGTPQDPSDILAQLRVKHGIAQRAQTPSLWGRNRWSIPIKIKLALIALGGVAIALLLLSQILG